MNTVTTCEKAKEVDGKNGKVAIYKVGLSDGRFGESFATQIPIGTKEEDIAIEETQWGLKFKLIKKNGYSGGSARAKAGNESFALSYAKDLVVAVLKDNPETAKKPTKDIAKVITGVADELFNWLESKKQ